MITEKYRKLNARHHLDRPGFGTGGARWAEMVVGFTESFRTEDVLDYGCGKSTLAAALPFDIKQYDPAIPAHEKLPQPADIVVCTDVLEHIEPQYLGAVLEHLSTLTLRVAFLNVSMRRANKNMANGQNPHLIVKRFPWWKAKLSEYFAQIEVIEKSETEFTALVVPRK